MPGDGCSPSAATGGSRWPNRRSRESGSSYKGRGRRLWRCRCTLLLRLPPGAFSPPPKVWSAVVGFVPHPEDPGAALFRTMERLTAAAFGQRRKMLRGALKPLGDAEALLEAAGIEGQRRAETLTVAEFDRMARLLLARQG